MNCPHCGEKTPYDVRQIRAWAQDMDVTQKQITSKFGVDRGHVSAIVHHKRHP